MTKLKISSQLSLPLSFFVTSTQAILGKKRGGKTYKASVQAEELLKAQQQIVVLDPTSAWWGLRSSASGKSQGFEIIIFGGEHADLPLEATASEIVADAILADGFSAIIDSSLFTKGEEQRFYAAFLERLYRKKRTDSTMHLFIDEADVVAPQKPFGEEARTLGACQSLVRRGGIKGIGCTLITQRPAVLNKDVLSQVDMLTVLRMNHPKDLDAIDTWVSVHGDPDTATKMIADLPSLPLGDAYVWAPVQDIFKRIEFRDRETFDSGATPKPGEKRRKAKLAKVDLDKLSESIRSSVERTKENDPKALKAKIAELIKERDQLARSVNESKPEKQSPPLREAQLKRVEKILAKIVALQGDWQDGAKRVELDLRALLDRVNDETRKLGDVVAILRPNLLEMKTDVRQRIPRIEMKTGMNGHQRKAPEHKTPEPKAPSDGGLPDGEAAILRAAIQYPNGLLKPQLTTLTGYKRSTRDAYISRLKARGLITEDRGHVFSTDVGKAALPDAEPLPVGAALREFWFSRLPDGEREVLKALVEAYPQPVDKDLIDQATGYKRSTRDAYISRLKSKELVIDVGRGAVAANDTLFDG